MVEPRTVFAAGPSRGGVGDVFGRLVEELAGRGHRVETLFVPRGRVPALSALRSAAAARRSIRTAQTVHVEFGSNDAEVFWFALAAVLMRRDCVVVIHDHPRPIHAPGAALISTSRRRLRAFAFRVLSPLLDGILERLLIRASAVLVVFNEEAQRDLLADGAAWVEVTALGSDPPARPLDPPSAGTSVLFAGFLGPHKGLDPLLEAWSRIKGEVELPLLIAGGASAPHDAWIDELHRRFAEPPNPPRFLGPVPEEREFQDLFDRAAIVVLPYRFSSPVSGVLVRAMAAGRAVISTPVPAATAVIVDGENGLLVPIDDVGAVAEAIVRLWRSPALRDRLGAAAAESAGRTFTWAQQAEGLERAYERAQRA